jgi:hypothetical protein
LNPDQIEWLRGWAAKNECKLDIQGTVGFGRPCVGIVYEGGNAFGGHYISYAWYGMEGNAEELRKVNRIVRNAAPPDAYHKDDYLAVLGEGYGALEQLYDWVVAIDAAGLVTEECYEPDLGPGTTTLTALVTGRRAKIRRLCYDHSAAK